MRPAEPSWEPPRGASSHSGPAAPPPLSRYSLGRSRGAVGGGVQARARASRELSRPVWVTGQSGQSKLHTTGEHRPGGPTTAGAEPDASGVRRACTTQPGPGAAGLGDTRDQWRSWPWDGRQTRACCLGGRTMPGAADPGRERSAHPWMAEVQGYMWWTSMEPAGGVMNRLLGGWSSDSDGRSLRIAGLERRAGPRHSTAPGGVRRETPAGHGWTGLRAETHG